VKQPHIIPPFLRKGDIIGIVATARHMDIDQLTPAIMEIERRGLNVKLASNIGKKQFQLAGTDQDRARAFQDLLNDQTVKAILIARGGYGTVRMVDKIDLADFTSNPKWVAGYSDVTVLHSRISSHTAIASLHSIMPVDVPTATTEAIEALLSSLLGERETWSCKGNMQRGTVMEGEIVGGNISVLCSLLGSEDQVNTDGKILFLEDLDEHLYHFDRMMQALRRAGSFTKLKGLIVGDVDNMRDNTKAFGFSSDNPWGSTATEIISECVKDFNFPMIFNFPAGHIPNNLALQLNRPTTITTNGDQLTIHHH
jgi:muramoyltetrapeptide carboxypeptidase